MKMGKIGENGRDEGYIWQRWLGGHGHRASSKKMRRAADSLKPYSPLVLAGSVCLVVPCGVGGKEEKRKSGNNVVGH